jgi:integrase/recombinase XerC
MRRMKPPIVPDQPVPIVPEDGLKRLFKACAGNTFEARRDTALLMLLPDTGARRDEMAGLKLSDIDLEVKPKRLGAPAGREGREATAGGQRPRTL